MEIIRGKLQSAQKIVLYGPEGIGKSTFAAQFPGVLFIDTEGSTKHIDVARLPRPTSWQMLLEEVNEVKRNPSLCQTLAIDTMDWAEKLCLAQILAREQKQSIEQFGYGKGYVYLYEEMGRLLNILEDVIEIGINVVLTAHAKMRKFEQPDEMGAYDRWELKLTGNKEKNNSLMVKEWADMVLFANYKTYTVKTEDKKVKPQGGARVMYTVHHPCWDAKNRHGLAPELPFDFKEIAHCIPVFGQTQPPPQAPAVDRAAPQPEPQPETKKPQKAGEAPPEKALNSGQQKIENPGTVFKRNLSQNLPGDLSRALRQLGDLMETHMIAPDEIQKAVFQRGHFPLDMPIEDYPLDFIEGCLIGAWPDVMDAIVRYRAKDDVPF